MSLPKFHLNHKPENKEALSLGERRQLHNIIVGILASLTEQAPKWLYEHSQVFVNESNAKVDADHDEFTFVIYTDKDNEEEDNVTATLIIDIDDEKDVITATTEYNDGKKNTTFSEKAWYRYDNGDSDKETTVEKTILPLAAFADEFVQSVVPKEFDPEVDQDERGYIIEDFESELN